MRLLRVCCLLVCLVLTSRGKTFAGNDLQLTFELGPDQEGYFLFAADAYTVSVEDDGKTTAIRAQAVFHLTPSDEKRKLIQAQPTKPVEVKVEVFSVHTRHHRTPILKGS